MRDRLRRRVVESSSRRPRGRAAGFKTTRVASRARARARTPTRSESLARDSRGSRIVGPTADPASRFAGALARHIAVGCAVNWNRSPSLGERNVSACLPSNTERAFTRRNAKHSKRQHFAASLSPSPLSLSLSFSLPHYPFLSLSLTARSRCPPLSHAARFQSAFILLRTRHLGAANICTVHDAHTCALFDVRARPDPCSGNGEMSRSERRAGRYAHTLSPPTMD